MLEIGLYNQNIFRFIQSPGVIRKRLEIGNLLWLEKRASLSPVKTLLTESNSVLREKQYLRSLTWESWCEMGRD